MLTKPFDLYQVWETDEVPAILLYKCTAECNDSFISPGANGTAFLLLKSSIGKSLFHTPQEAMAQYIRGNQQELDSLNKRRKVILEKLKIAKGLKPKK